MQKAMKILLMAAIWHTASGKMGAIEATNANIAQNIRGNSTLGIFWGGVGAVVWGGWQIWRGVQYRNKEREIEASEVSLWRLSLRSRSSLRDDHSAAVTEYAICPKISHEFDDVTAGQDEGSVTKRLEALRNTWTRDKKAKEVGALMRIHQEARFPYSAIDLGR